MRVLAQRVLPRPPPLPRLLLLALSQQHHGLLGLGLRQRLARCCHHFVWVLECPAQELAQGAATTRPHGTHRGTGHVVSARHAPVR